MQLTRPIATAIFSLFVTGGVSFAAGLPDHAEDEATIWKLEQGIYAQRGEGKMSLYLSVADPNYAGWPPQVAAPMALAQLKGQESRAADNTGERIELQKQLIQFDSSGNTALAYYSSHRTRRGGGIAVDERWETIHVWVRSADGWKLMGGMARPVPEDRAALGVAPQPE